MLSESKYPVLTYAMCLLAFSIPLYFNMQSIAVAALGIAWIMGGHFQGALKRFHQNSFGIWWILIFILYTISLLYSDNKEYGITDLGRKLSLLLLPIFICSSRGWNKRKMDFIFIAYVLGILTALVICFIQALMHYSALGSWAFFSDHFAGATHNNAVNLSGKVILAMLLLLFYQGDVKGQSWFSKEMSWVLIIVFFLGLILLASKSMLPLMLLFMLFALHQKLKNNLKIYLAVILGGVILLGTVLTMKESPLLRRFTDLTNFYYAQKAGEKQDVSMTDNLSKRLVLGKSAWQNLQKENYWLVGCGIGDWKELQRENLSSAQFEFGNYTNFQSLGEMNVHNNYLQVWLTIGLPGLLFLCIVSLGGWIISWKIRSNIFFWHHFLFVLYMFQESAFETQSGLVFYCFFSCVFITFNHIHWKGRALQKNL